MTMLETLTQQETARHDAALADYADRLRRAEHLDDYRRLLAADESQDIDDLRKMMATLKLSPDDVKADAEALEADRQARLDVLDDDGRAGVDTARDADIETVRCEIAETVAGLWAQLPAATAVNVARHVGAVLEANGCKGVPSAACLAGWGRRLREADETERHAVAADRRARQTIADLAQKFPRVLGDAASAS